MIYLHNSINGSNKYCEFCNRNNFISIHECKILNNPVFLFVNYINMNIENNNTSIRTAKETILSETIENGDDVKYCLIGYTYQNGGEFFSRSYHPYVDEIIEYNGKKCFGKVCSVSKTLFTTPDEGLGIYINENYYDRAKFQVIHSFEETDDTDSFILSNKKRVHDIISNNDLYYKESDYTTNKIKFIGKGLFSKKVILTGTRFPPFEGVVISAENYAKKPIAEKGFGIQIDKNISVFDCYVSGKICMASYANDPNKLIHYRDSHVSPTANTKCVQDNQRNELGMPVFVLEAIKQIEPNEEIFWEYDSIANEYFSQENIN